MNHNSNETVVSFGPTCDLALVLAARNGDERAFEVLANHYQPRIFAVAMRYTRVREDAEDIVQQTLLKAFVHLHRFEGRASFRTWLTRIAINEALMFLRRGHVLRQLALDDLSEDETATRGLEIPDSCPDPEANCLKREGTELLSAAIAKLTVRLRVAIELRELAGLSMRETARRMGVSVAAVKARIFRGRSKLRKTLPHLGITARGAQPQ
jgi:RNA polymerase sigma-70 factor (ECF subfamily)